jgi:hypothetical protein
MDTAQEVNSRINIPLSRNMDLIYKCWEFGRTRLMIDKNITFKHLLYCITFPNEVYLQIYPTEAQWKPNTNLLY